MKKIKTHLLVMIFLSISFAEAASSEWMKDMPLIKPKRVYSVQSKEEGEVLRDQRGFGDREPEVRMKNLMMVEGSGYEGMDMEAGKTVDAKSPPSSRHEHSMATSDGGVEITKSPNLAKIGSNLFEFVVKDRKTGKPLSGLKPTTQVYMTSMDMGTESPRVEEFKTGHYRVKVLFSMQGSWALKIISPLGEKIFNIQVSK